MDSENGLFLPRPVQTAKSVFLPNTRRGTRTLVLVFVASTLLLSGWLYASDAPRHAFSFVSSTFSYRPADWPTKCSPEDWSDGEWVSKSPALYPLEHYLSLYPYNASNPEPPSYTPTPEVARHPFAPLGFAGCASGRERQWHLSIEENGTPDKNHPEMWEYVVRGASYDWVPKSRACRAYNEHVAREKMIRQLVEQGGWFFVGDSVTEQHFFSMSCMLSPHVIATPDYAPHGGSGPRDWPQHLYLNPSSPLIHQLKFPRGFDAEKTPLVTFRRVDLLFSPDELDAVHRSMHNMSLVPSTLFGPDASESFNLSPEAYLEIFKKPLPEANYKVMIVSTAGHWTTASLPGARDPDSIGETATNPAVYKTFVKAVDVWTRKISRAIEGSDRQVLIRAYLPGHEYDCHKEQGPLTRVREFSQEWYNWSWIGRMNDAFKEAVRARADPHIRFLGLDKPALLRPDAHSLSDCLHIQIGAGIFEGWARYIWQFMEDLRRT